MIFYQTDKCPFEFLTTLVGDVKPSSPWYEMHISKDKTYDSFQKGVPYSVNKPLSKAGFDLLMDYVDLGYMTKDINKARINISTRGIL